MQLQLLQAVGFNGSMRNGVYGSHPSGQLIYASGSQLVLLAQGKRQPTLLHGHDDAITTFAISPNGQLAATGQRGANADVVLWDLRTLQPVSRFQELDGEVTMLCFSLDSRLLLAVGMVQGKGRTFSKLYVLDSSSGHIVTTCPLDDKRVTAAAFAPQTSSTYSFATALEGGELLLWGLDPYARSQQLSECKVTMGSVHRPLMTSLIFSATDGGAWLYVGTGAGDILTVNVARTAVQLVHPAVRHGVGAMVMSSSGQLLVGGGDGSLTLFSNDHMWRDMTPFCRVPGTITSLTPTHDGAALVVGTKEGVVLRVASGSFAVEEVTSGHTGSVACASSGVGAGAAAGLVATASLDNSVRLWDAQAGTLLGMARPDPAAAGCLCVDVSLPSTGGGPLLVTGWGDGALRGFRPMPQGLAPAWTLPGAHVLAHSCGATALSVAHRGHFIVSGGEGGEVRMWDVGTREMVLHMKQHNQRACAVAVLADDAHCVVASEDCALKAADLSTGACSGQWITHAPLRALAVGHDQVTLVTGGVGQHLTVWDLRSPDPVRVVHQAHRGDVGSLAMGLGSSPLLASGGSDGMVRVWDMRATAQGPVAASGGHTDLVTALCWVPGATGQGAALVSGARDGCMATWQLAGL